MPRSPFRKSAAFVVKVALPVAVSAYHYRIFTRSAHARNNGSAVLCKLYAGLEYKLAVYQLVDIRELACILLPERKPDLSRNISAYSVLAAQYAAQRTSVNRAGKQRKIDCGYSSYLCAVNKPALCAVVNELDPYLPVRDCLNDLRGNCGFAI